MKRHLSTATLTLLAMMLLPFIGRAQGAGTTTKAWCLSLQDSPGIYQFNSTDPYGYTIKWPLEDGEIASAGAYGAGRYYVMVLNSSSTTPKGLYAYNLKTGERELVKSMTSDEYYLTDLTYDSRTDMLYGLLNDYPYTTIEKIDPSTGVATPIKEVSDLILYGIAADYDGQLYAGSVYGKIYKVNKTTGDIAEIYATQKTCNNLQSLDFDYNTGELYWIMQGYWGSELYVIDLKNKTLSNALQFPTYSKVGGLHLAYTAANVDSPAAVSDLVAEQNAQKQAVLSWKNPAMTLGGQPLTALSKVEVYCNGVLAKQFDNVSVGSDGSYTDETVTGKENRYKVIAYSDDNDGFPAWVNMLSGYDKPGAPQNATAEKLSESSISLKWEAPATGVNGYPYDLSTLVYKVVRKPDMQVVVESTTETQLVDESIEKYANYQYEITAITAAGVGGSTTSNAVTAGPGEQLPFTSLIDTEADFLRWSVYDCDETEGSWYFDKADGTGKNAATSDDPRGRATDNYLVSPPLYLEGGENYELTFDVATAYYSTENIRVKLGVQPDPESLTTTLKEVSVNGKYYSPESVSVVFAVEQTGYYHVGFEHWLTAGDTKGMVAWINNVSLHELSKGSISGTVSDGEGNPFPGATVKLTGKTELEATTGEDGKFAFDEVPAGDYTVTASAFGFKQKAVAVSVAVDAPAVADIAMEAMKQYKLTGRIRNNSDEPISGARITLTGYATYHARSDADGVYEFPAVYEGEDHLYKIKVQKNNYKPYESTQYVYSDSQIYPIRLSEKVVAPASISVDNAEGPAVVAWEKPIDIAVFSYDNGTASQTAFGFDGGRENNVVGNIFRTPIRLCSVSWYTIPYSSEKSEIVNLYILNLDEEGNPTGELLYSQPGIPTTDNQWTEYQLPQVIEAPNGFVLAVSGDGNVCLATDTNEAVVAGRSQFYSNFYNSPDAYTYFETNGYKGALMLRANGEPIEVNPTMPTHTFDLWRFAEADRNAEDKWVKLAKATTDNAYTDTELPTLAQGVYYYAVAANYPNNQDAVSDKVVSEAVNNRLFSDITVSVTTNSVAADAEGAQVKLQNAGHSYNVAVEDGKARFPQIWKGIYALSIAQKGFDTIEYEVDFGTEPAYSLQYALTQILAPVQNIDVVTAETDSERTLMWDFFANIEDGFEGDEYTDFEINPAGAYGWQYIDNDGLPTYGWGTATYPGMRDKMAAMVFNSTATTPPVGQNTAYEGNRALGFFCASESVSDDYFISPLLDFHKDFKITFHARSYENYDGLQEQFRVGYSTTNAGIEDFTWFDMVSQVPIEYTEYSYDIPADATYVCINSQSPNVFLLLVDNIFIGTDNPTSGEEPTFGSFDSYDVALDGNKVAERTKETSILLTDLQPGLHTASVVKNYKSGVSEPLSISFDVDYSGISYIDNGLMVYANDGRLIVKGDYRRLSIMNVAGTTVLDCGNQGQMIDISNLTKGIYIVQVKTTDGRSVVRKIVAD